MEILGRWSQNELNLQLSTKSFVYKTHLLWLNFLNETKFRYKTESCVNSYRLCIQLQLFSKKKKKNKFDFHKFEFIVSSIIKWVRRHLLYHVSPDKQTSPTKHNGVVCPHPFSNLPRKRHWSYGSKISHSYMSIERKTRHSWIGMWPNRKASFTYT